MKSLSNVAMMVVLGIVVAGCGRAPAPAADKQAAAAAAEAAAAAAGEKDDAHIDAARPAGGDSHGHGHEDSHAEALRLTPQAREAAGLQIVTAGPALLVESLPLYGVIRPNAERLRSVTARFPGVVREVSVKVGDRVRQGQTLARIESNESLQVYATASPLAGVVTERFTNPGEQAETAPLFTVADLRTVWVELSLFPRDRARVQLGQDVRIEATEGGLSGDGKIVFVSPLGSGASQTITARVLLDNAQGQWVPGLYVRADVAVGKTHVALAVPAVALQELDEGGLSVFVDEAQGLVPRPVRAGRHDGRQVEILAGIEAGARVVAEGSFVLKAEQGKGGAEHGH
jgi:cobalt-zinc-cadmium efflux system membrane fusion protein